MCEVDMGSLKKAGLDEIYNHIMGTASLEETVVAKNPVTAGKLSFVELDSATRQNVVPDIEDLNEIARQKARFMLDVCVLNLLRKGAKFDPSKLIAIDVHFSSLVKTAFRTRYLTVLADVLERCEYPLMLNIKSVPVGLHATRISDLLRYLIPVKVEAALQISQENILTQDLIKMSAKYFVLSVAELTRINASMRKDMTLQHLSKLPGQDKHIIVRNAAKEVVVEPAEEAFYL